MNVTMTPWTKAASLALFALLTTACSSGKKSTPEAVDEVPPQVTVSAPPATEEITGDTITLSGTASDAESGVASVSLKVGDNAPMAATINGNNWTVEVPVSIGDNSIVVTVTDGKGLQTVNDPITVTKADNVAPTLTLTSHENNGTITGANITLSGTAVDAHSTIASVTISINGTESTATYDAEAGTWSAADLPINIGANTITVLATDSQNNSSELQTFTLNKADDVAPVLAITSPANNSAATGAATTVSGTATDANSEIASVSLSNNGSAAIAATLGEAGAWSASIPLSIGANAIQVTATDAAGNTSAAQSITLNKADDIPPTLAITAPTEGQSVTGASVNVTGTASDANSGLASVSLSNNGGDAIAATIGDGGAWTATVPISIGANAITITAIDNQGLPTQSAVNVTKADDVKPLVAITSHTEGQAVSGETAAVSGTVSDEHSGLTGLTVTIKLRELEVQRTDTDGTWLDNLPLEVGDNVITVTASDAAGNVSDPVSVTLVKADDVQPTVAITSHTDGEAATGETITISGTSADEHSSVASITLSANASEVAAENITLNEDGSWSVTNVPINIGSNTITVTATDSVGNTSESASIALNKADDQEPTVAIKFPPPVSMTEDAIVYVRGEAQDAHTGVESVSVTVNDVAATSNGGGALALTLTKGAELTDVATWNVSGLDLVDGLNTVKVTVTDASENQTTSDFSITKADITSAFPEGNDLFENPYSAVIDESQGYARALVVDYEKLAVISVNLLTGVAEVLSDNISQVDLPFRRPSQIALVNEVAYVVDGIADSVFQINLGSGERSVFMDVDVEPAIVSPIHVTQSNTDNSLYLAESSKIHRVNIGSREVILFSDSDEDVPDSVNPLDSISALFLDESKERLLATSWGGVIFGISLSDGSREILFDKDIDQLNWLTPGENENEFYSSDSASGQIVVVNVESGEYVVKSSGAEPSENGNRFLLPTGVNSIEGLGYVIVSDYNLAGVAAMDKESGWRVIVSKSVHTP